MSTTLPTPISNKTPIKIKGLSLLISFSIATSFQTQASGVGGDLDKFFDDLGYHTNVSEPNSYKGQSANFYNGGSLYVRTSIRNAQLMSVTVPSISLGCGGIDAFMGGFSHINSDKLVQFGKAVVANAVPFAVDLALQTWAPSIKAIRDNLQAIADKWLNQSINSCETAQATVGGLAAFTLPQTKKHVCATIGTHNNVFSDWLSAQQECGVGGQAAAQTANARNEPSLEDLTKTSHNIVWSSIMKNAFLSSDTDLAEFLMSLSGTYIYDKDGKPRYFSSLLTDNNNLVQALLEGGEINYYQCDDTDVKKCLNPSAGTLTLSKAKGLKNRIYDMLKVLYESLLNDTALTDSQKALLEYTETPVLSVFKGSIMTGIQPKLDAYAHVIAVELLNRYLTNMLNVVKQSMVNTSIDRHDITLIVDDITKAARFMDGQADKARKIIIDQQTLIQTYKTSDQEFMKLLSDKMQQNITFGESD